MKVPDGKVRVFHVSTEVFSTINGFIENFGFNPFKLLLRPNDIYKFMTLLPKDYYLIPDNGA